MFNTQHRAYKLKRQAAHAIGHILDLGFAANPNPFLTQAVGLDLVLPQEKPTNYHATVRCNLNLEPLPFAAATFDTVIAGDLIEHLENPSAFLREVNRVLKPAGRLIVCTPQANDWWTTIHNWFFRRWINDPDPGVHLQNWTILDMTRLLRKNGFRVDCLEGLFFRTPKFPILIPVKHFPILAWQVMYVAKKTSSPANTAIGFADGEWHTVSQ